MEGFVGVHAWIFGNRYTTHSVSLDGVLSVILGGWTREVADLRQGEIGEN